MSEWNQISYLGFLYLIMGVGEIRFSKFRSETAFSKQGYFRHFCKNFRAFSQIGLTYLFFAFWRLQRHQNVETRSRLARNHVLLLKMFTINLIIIPKVWEGFHFIELCILIHDFTIQGLYGVTEHDYMLRLVNMHIMHVTNYKDLAAHTTDPRSNI